MGLTPCCSYHCHFFPLLYIHITSIVVCYVDKIVQMGLKPCCSYHCKLFLFHGMLIGLNLSEYLAIDRAQWHKDSCSQTQLIGTKAWFRLVRLYLHSTAIYAVSSLLYITLTSNTCITNSPTIDLTSWVWASWAVQTLLVYKTSFKIRLSLFHLLKNEPQRT